MPACPPAVGKIASATGRRFEGNLELIRMHKKPFRLPDTTLLHWVESSARTIQWQTGTVRVVV